jgi:hypothetical protein
MRHRNNTGKSTASLSAAYRSEVDYSSLTLANEDTALFIWVDEVEDEFTHSSGIVIKKTLAKNRERWGQVMISNIPGLEVGEYIVVDAVHEPFGCVINGLEHWMSYSKNIVCASPDHEVTNTFAGDVSPNLLSNQK